MQLVKRLKNIPPPRTKFDPQIIKSSYFNDGYAILPKIFTSEESNLLKSTIANDPSISNNTMPMVDSNGKESKLTLWFELGDDLYSMFARSSTIYHAVQELLNTEPYMFHSKIMMKEPKIGGAWNWHQDFGYWYEQGGTIPDQCCSVMVAIDDHNVDNGCLQVYKSSHKFGRIEHGLFNDQNSIEPNRLNNIIHTNCDLVNCELNNGDILIFHSLLVHGSKSNTSDNWRRALITGYNGRYAPIFQKGENDFVIPSYSEIDVIHDDEIMKCGTKPHSSTRNDFFSKEDNVKSFTPTEGTSN